VLRSRCAGVTVELLVPDFAGSVAALTEVLSVRPDILAHNVETVPRLYPQVRRGADYRTSLALLRGAKAIAPGIVTKSGVMLGLGEQAEEVAAVLRICGTPAAICSRSDSTWPLLCVMCRWHATRHQRSLAAGDRRPWRLVFAAWLPARWSGVPTRRRSFSGAAMKPWRFLDTGALPGA